MSKKLTSKKLRISRSRLWDGVDLYDEYQVVGPHGKILSRHTLDEIVLMAEHWLEENNQ